MTATPISCSELEVLEIYKSYFITKIRLGIKKELLLIDLLKDVLFLRAL